jgi:beta-lactamase regulating signal transducer with metallopeptidase domain
MMDALFNAGLRGTVALLAAWIVTGLLRKASAELRHWIWLMALVSIASLLIPLPVPESARISLVVAPISGGTPLLSPGLSVMTESIWAAGAFLLLLRFVSGMVQLYRLEHSGKQSEADDVLVCDVGVPMTWGVMRPVILVPEYVTDWSREKQEYLILHERAHIQRRDWLWQSFARMVTAVFWFHPLVWRHPACAPKLSARPTIWY